DLTARGTSAVLACSALRRIYRDQLRAPAPTGTVRFAYLRTPRAVLEERLRERSHHFATPSLLPSQLETLEEPTPDEHPIVVDASAPVEEIVRRITEEAGGAGD